MKLSNSRKSLFESLDVPNLADHVPEEKFRAQIRNFPDLPPMAHGKIREFGNEIVACYTAQLCKFYNDSLIETAPNCNAVLTKKSRTGQRWLMVFRNERGRVTVSYNKLLTNQLMVHCLNPVSIEVEAARGLRTTPQETCVFTFNSHNEANKFLHDIHESQTIVWNHREMFLEQSLRSSPAEFYMEGPASFGFYSPRPLSARSLSGCGYIVPPDIPQSLTPRMKVLPPVPQTRPKKSPFTVSVRAPTPKADLDENWRNCGGENVPTPKPSTATEITATTAANQSTTQSPIRKRSKGSKEGFGAPVGGDGEFVYNSLTHSMALQQNVASTLKQMSNPEGNPNMPKEVNNKRRFQTLEILVSNKRDVGTGAPDEEFSSMGSGEILVIDNGEEQFDEIKCFSSDGLLMFSQTLFGWNKVRTAEGSKNPKIRWWIGAAVLGTGIGTPLLGRETPRIREFKAIFFDEESANKFSELFHEGCVKGNNPEVRSKYLAQSLRV